MTTIWKYALPLEDRVIIYMPYGAHVLHVGNQDGVLCLWVLVDPDQPERAREFLVCGTGHPAPSSTHPYLGSAVVSPFVWHVFGGNLVPHIKEELAVSVGQAGPYKVRYGFVMDPPKEELNATSS